MSGQNLVLSRQGLTDITVSLAGFVTSGELTSAIADFKTGTQITSEIGSAIADKATVSYVDTQDASLAASISAVQSDFDSLPEDENDFVSSADMIGDVLKLTRTDGGVVSVDLSQFKDDTDTDNFVTGASMVGDTLTLARTNGDVTVSLSRYQTSSEVASQITTAIAGYATEAYVSTQLNPYAIKTSVSAADNSLSTRIASLEGGLDAEVSSRIESEDYVVTAAMSNDTLKLTRAQGGVVTVDLSQFKDNTDNFLTGVSLTGDVLSLSRVSGGSVTVNLGQYQTSSEVASQIGSAIAGYATESYVDTADANLLSKITSVDTRFGGLPNEDYVSSAELSNQTLKLTRAQGSVVSVNLGTFTTSGELSTALVPYAKGTNVATDISDAVAVEASNRVVKDNSLNTRVNSISTTLGTEISTTDSEVISLNTRVGSVSGNLTTLTGRVNNVSTLTGTLSSDVEALQAAGYDDSSINERVSSVESIREKVDGDLGGQIGDVSTALVNEITATNGDISSLNTRVAGESSVRGSGDSSLATAISNEAAARAAADAQLASDIASHNELSGLGFASNTLTVQGTQANYSVDLTSLTTDVTVTGGTYNSASQQLSLTKNNGDIVKVSGFAIDTDTDNYVDSVAFNTTNGVLTLGRTGSLADLTVDLDGRYLVDSKDTYTTGATFNTGNGVLTITNNDGGTFTVDLDGRFTDNGYADAMNQHVRTTDTPTFAKINTGLGATEVHLMNQNVRTSDNVSFNAVTAGNVTAAERVNINQTAIDGTQGFLTINTDVEILGELRAQTKSFLIDHPTQPNMKLQYGNLEGPEHGVYVRGKVGADGVIELPEYWTELVNEDSITVQLTAIGSANAHFVESIEDNKVKVGSESGEVNAFYMVNAERKDIYKLKVEFPA